MRKVRSRLTIILFAMVIGSCILSLTLFTLIETGVLFQRDDARFLISGYAVRDVLLLAGTVVLAVLLILRTSHSATDPILQLNRATKEIASGNFDVTVEIQDLVEEFGELERNFNRMAAELKSNEYLRKDFISSVSHELRTPLSILRGYAELLAEGGLSQAEQREYALYIVQESERLAKLTENMLRLARMDHSELPLKRQRFSLDEQLRQAILRLEPRWSGKGLEMDVELQSAEYVGDEELLSQVWVNLLDNAVKYTPEGGSIRVRLALGDDAVTVDVADNGKGMPPEVLSRIFEQFYRGESGRAGEGSGLGLSLAKRIVELHGGSLTVKSSVGAGSVFTAALPLPR